MQAPAQAKARGLESRAQAVGDTLRGVAQQLGAIPLQQIQAQQQQTQAESQALTLTEQRRSLTVRDAFSTILKDTPRLSEDGVSVWDVAAIGRQLAERGYGAESGALLAHLNDINTAFRTERAAKLAVLNRGAQSVIAAGNDPDFARHFLDQAEANQMIAPAEAEKLRRRIAADPASVAQITAYYAGPQKFGTVGAGSQVFNETTGQLTGAQVPANPTEASLAVSAAAGDAQAAAALAAMREPPASQAVEFRLNGRDYKGSFIPDKSGQGGRYVLPDGTEAVGAQPIPPVRQPQYEWGKDPQTGAVRLMPKEDIIARGFTRPSEFEMVQATPPAYQDAAERSVASVPANRRAFWGNLFNRQIIAGDIDGLKSSIRQAAIEGENADTQKMVEGRRDALSSITQIGDLLASIGDTNYLTGSIEDVVRRLGTTSDPRLVEIGSRLDQTLFNYRRAMTGVQFSLAESDQYKKLWPNYTNTVPVNLALVRSLASAMANDDRLFWEQKLGTAGARLIGAVPPPAPPPPTIPAGATIQRAAPRATTPAQPSIQRGSQPAPPPATAPRTVPPGVRIQRGT